MRQNKPNTKTAERKLRGLTSLNQDEYDILFAHFDALICQKPYHYTLKGSRRQSPSYQEASNSSLYGSKNKLDFNLMYMKENTNQVYHAHLFGISQSKVSEWIHYLLPVLQDSLDKLSMLPDSGYSYEHPDDESDYLLVDVTERQVGRRESHSGQREEYSGKKKGHRIKNLAVSDPKGRLLYLSPSFEGAMHDKKIWDQLQMPTSNLNWLADLGFLGIEKGYSNLILPYKKPKKAALTELHK